MKNSILELKEDFEINYLNILDLRKWSRLREGKQPQQGHKADLSDGFNTESWELFKCFNCFFIVFLHFKKISPYRKRAESDSRKSSIPNSKEVPSHHPTDPVELRRLNFQTPGKRQGSSCP